MLAGAHAMLAVITSQPAFKLDDEECKQLAAAVAQVSRHYEMRAHAKTADWINLLSVAGMVYAPRLMVVVATRKPKRGAQPKADTASEVEDLQRMIHE